ncbi:DUF4249 domain-containing protein [Spirosoma sordidisoli]|uniref:DUF4249 domain-containing protein n=1 Tax=Spirosoma sordidisoli TaxID=2502893 RepID=A0A4Q2UNL9_9BACT|nr:DUF4249 domain-containing protein [Spirosoma sordidisoli]RYC70926.1 DUF4249 domain-containing protein [Spirosoma sordidisoli]
MRTRFTRPKRSGQLVSIWLFLLAGCVTEYQPETLSLPPGLVVEGQVTDQPGPYTVRLTRTGDYSNQGFNLLEQGATLTIEDNAGNRETLTEVAGGTYQTKANGLRGLAGRRYKLTILTKAGKRYESDAELLTSAPPILKAYAEYRNEAIAGTANRRQGWDVYIDTQDPETSGNFYRWDWVHYEPVSACARVVENPRTNAYHDLYCCTFCWDIERCYNCLNVNSDASINGKVLSRQLITRVPFTSTQPYYLEIEQQAISQGAYTFWKSVRGLVNNTGGLFDPAPAMVQGNIRNTADAAEPVFGYFGATGISVVPLRVNRSDVQGAPPAQPQLLFRSPPDPCFPCENSPYRTSVTPRWWVF